MDNILLIFFIFLRIISNPAANTLQKSLSLNYSSIVINIFTYAFLSIFCLFRINEIFKYDISLTFIFLVITCGFLCTLGMICMIKAVNIGELSVIGPINSYKSIISLLIAMIFLKEIPSFSGFIGIILIAYGSWFFFKGDDNQKISIIKRKDIQFRILAMTFTAIEAVLLKKVIILSSPEVCFIYWCFTGFLWSFILLFLLKKTIVLPSIKSIDKIFIISVCLGIMQFSTNYVFEKINVAYALSLFQLSSIVSVLFGYKFFHEKNILSKLIGSVIMIIGSCLIITG